MVRNNSRPTSRNRVGHHYYQHSGNRNYHLYSSSIQTLLSTMLKQLHLGIVCFLLINVSGLWFNTAANVGNNGIHRISGTGVAASQQHSPTSSKSATATAEATTTTTTTGTTTTSSSTTCTNYGCPILPGDVINDQNVQIALGQLQQKYYEQQQQQEQQEQQQQNSNSEEDDDNELIKILEELIPYGDNDKTTMTLKGYKGGPIDQQINQDRSFIISPYGKPPPMIQILGVFDGHGPTGELTSQHAQTEVPKQLATKLSILFEKYGNTKKNEKENETTTNQKKDDDDNSSSKDIIKYYNTIEFQNDVKKAIHDVFVNVDKTDPSNGRGGCTASIILQIGSKIYVANSGDSVSLLATYVEATTITQPKIIYTTKDHKPNIPNEQERILKAGGYVHIPKNHLTDPNSDVPRAYSIDHDTGRLGGGLAMSRSIGDWHIPGVIPDPTIDILDIQDIISNAVSEYYENVSKEQQEEESCKANNNNNNDDDKENNNNCKVNLNDIDPIDPTQDVNIIAISGTDGLMDEVSKEEIVHVYVSSFCLPNNPHPHIATNYLILKAANNWDLKYDSEYRDDIAVAALKIHIEE